MVADDGKIRRDISENAWQFECRSLKGSSCRAMLHFCSIFGDSGDSERHATWKAVEESEISENNKIFLDELKVPDFH